MPITSGASGGLFEHLVEIVDDHVRKLLGRILAGDDRRDIVYLLRIGHREDAPAVAGREPDRLVVHAPVEEVGVAALCEKVGRDPALRDPRPEPAGRPLALERLDHRGRLLDERPFHGGQDGSDFKDPTTQSSRSLVNDCSPAQARALKVR
jgi:hypothetical protein